MTATRSTHLLDGKRLLVTGVLTPKSIAYAIAERALEEGAELLFTSFGRAMSLTERSARRLSDSIEVLELDVTRDEHFAALTSTLEQRDLTLDGVVHAIGFAPEDALGGGFMDTPWQSVETAMRVSAYSLAELARATRGRMARGGSIVSLTFDATVAWPMYDWMGPTKAALESITRYLARDLGAERIRVNTIAAGPIDSIAAKSIPAFSSIKELWNAQAPIVWDSGDASPIADAALFLLSDLSRAVTGEMLHVDGGYHAIGARIREEGVHGT